jgi:hypothetical protein
MLFTMELCYRIIKYVEVEMLLEEAVVACLMVIFEQCAPELKCDFKICIIP